MTQSATGHHPPPAGQHPERPKGILKNPSQIGSTSPTGVVNPLTQTSSGDRPQLGREMSEKEIVLQNTLQNAGHRRSSSNPRGPPSRRESAAGAQLQGADENSPRLKWDEANLYLTEQQRDSTMKINEPKTPYAKQYDPTEDEAEIAGIKADELMVDELDIAKAQKKSNKEDEIPGLDIGEPEMTSEAVHTPESEKRVIVDADMLDEEGRHGEETADMTVEEREKHRKFEEMRKKHYEMKNVKDLLGHPEELMDEDDDEQPPAVPTQ